MTARKSTENNDLNVILFGPPGVGKGAQAQLLSHRFGLRHLSTGEVIREEIARGTPLGIRVREAVNRGEFADDKTVLDIVTARIDRPEYAKGFVMDGFPRTVRQAELFDKLLEKRGRKVSWALFINAPEKTILERLTGRLVCSQCGRTYHRVFQRPHIDELCDDCMGKVIRRHDDDPATHKERLRTYHDKTLPLSEYYEKGGTLVNINGDRTVDEVHAEISRAIDRRRK